MCDDDGYGVVFVIVLILGLLVVFVASCITTSTGLVRSLDIEDYAYNMCENQGLAVDTYYWGKTWDPNVEMADTHDEEMPFVVCRPHDWSKAPKSIHDGFVTLRE